ncbi:MAG: ATP synthase F1 subunit delta [Alphaproteobacteria bacterium]
MKSVSAASRYARATLKVAAESKVYGEVVAQAAVLAEALAEGDMAAMLASPKLDKRDREGVVANVVKACKLNPVLGNLMTLLAGKGRLALLPDVLRDISVMADVAGGVARVTVEAASPLSAAQLDSLKAVVKADTQAKSVEIETTANPALIGGFMAFFGGKVWDASVRGQLDRMKTALVDVTQQFHQTH